MKILKSLRYIILLFVFMLFYVVDAGQSRFENDKSKATITNTGTIRIRNNCDIKGMPDTIGGRVEFLMQEDNRSQIIPNITYKTLFINSKSWLRIDSLWGAQAISQPLTTLDSLIIISDSFRLRLEEVELHAKGFVSNQSAIRGGKYVRANRMDSSQLVGGGGVFSRFSIENPFGIELFGGGFRVENKLDIVSGGIRGDSINKVTIGDKNLIRGVSEVLDSTMALRIDTTKLSHPKVVRHSGTKVEGDFSYEEASDLTYVGAGSIITMGEAPEDKSIIKTLSIENADSLVLARNLTVNDSLYIGTHVHTSDLDTLTLASKLDPVFNEDNPEAEVHGNFRRLDWQSAGKIILNNPYTYLLFKKPIDRDEISELVSTIYPKRYNILAGGAEGKVERSIRIEAHNSDGEISNAQIEAEMGYAWRHVPNNSSKDESGDLPFDNLVLLRYDDGAWISNESSSVPQLDGDWGYSHVTHITEFGNFAIGAILDYILVAGKVRLEGAYRYETGLMGTDLQRKGLISMPPPDIYPYNLDPNREYYVRTDGQLPDSVVDWVIVEMRKSYMDEPIVNTLLLHADGSLVDIYGNKKIYLTPTGLVKYKDGTIELPESPESEFIIGKPLYVAVRHRNHAAVISSMPIKIQVGVTSDFDFTSPDFVMAAAASLKKVSKDLDGNFLYGMIAGDVSGGILGGRDGIIDNIDYGSILPPYATWTNSLFEGYLLNDLDLNGIITTRDFNIGFNNRNRKIEFPH